MGTGTGTLVVGADADIALAAATKVGLELRATGRLVFELGAMPAFKPIDLHYAAESFAAPVPGATILIDGTKLAAVKNVKPITLITYKRGARPGKQALENVRIGYTGFAPGIKPALIWTDTALQLRL